MEKYESIKQIGEGTFGKVFHCKNIKTGKYVAIKKSKIDQVSGISFTTLREIKTLKKIKSSYIVEMIDVFMSANSKNSSIYLVLEYMPYDLTGLLICKYKFTDEQIYSLAYQMINGLECIHSAGLIHRDIKPSNILIDAEGKLKLTDFGLTRELNIKMTNRVCTLWYRAPELLLGDTEYNDKVDSWSVGCIILDMKNGGPYFKGKDEVEQVDTIFSKLGRPGISYPWDDLFNLQKYEKQISWNEIINNNFGEMFDEKMIRLLRELLRLEKNKRISIKHASKFQVISENAEKFYPIDLSDTHEFNAKLIE